MLNDQQAFALDKWKEGNNIKVTAVPGAGKSRVLLEVCKSYTEGLILILAYNHDLCEETKKKIIEEDLGDTVICLTFHGLATYCIMPCYDDTALFDAIEGVESGEIQVNTQIRVSAVLIDEAQDFRPSFLRLLKLVLQLPSNVQYMVVGDPNQMLYTYDDEDPADIKYLSSPGDFFLSTRQWIHVEFFKTHRLSPPMANLVSKIFDVNVQSAKPESGTYLPVHLFSINLWKAGSFIWQHIQYSNLENLCILVPQKKNNGPLRVATNYLSSKGVKIYLHGFDGQDSRIRKNKLCIGTWHSSKGTEKNTVIVLGLNSEVETNPCFVALSRSIEKLIIIQDIERPYDKLINALKRGTSEDVIVCEDTKKLIVQGYTIKEKIDFQITSQKTYAVDNFRPKGTARWIRDHFESLENTYTQNIVFFTEEHTDEENDVIQISEFHEDVSDVYTYAICMAVEYELTGKVRLLEDIKSPIRLSREKQEIAIINGHHSRFITPNIPMNTLLGEDMLDIINIYNRGAQISYIQWCELACLARSWNDFHHTMRQLYPFDWFDVDKFQSSCNFFKQFIASQDDHVEFDIRLKYSCEAFNHVLLHARAHAVSDNAIYYLVWGNELTHTHKLNAIVRAALHKKPMAHIVNLRINTVESLVVKEPTKFLRKLVFS